MQPKKTKWVYWQEKLSRDFVIPYPDDTKFTVELASKF